jgi:hypothetical protein
MPHNLSLLVEKEVCGHKPPPFWIPEAAVTKGLMYTGGVAPQSRTGTRRGASITDVAAEPGGTKKIFICWATKRYLVFLVTHVKKKKLGMQRNTDQSRVASLMLKKLTY